MKEDTKMSDDHKSLMTMLSDRELVEAIQERYSSYPHVALSAGLEEAQRRGLKCADAPARAYLAQPEPKRFVPSPPPVLVSYACPKCQTPMDLGRSYVQGTTMGFLFFGMSYKHLYFESRNSGQRFVVVGNSDYRNAYRCSGCGLTVLD
jgi:hypothetical protein